MSQQSVADILRRISSRSYDALRRFDVALPHSQPSVRSKELTIIQTPFPYPASIIPSLLKEGVTTTFADLASRVYLQSALLLKRECERQVQQVTQAWVETRSCSSDANIPTQVASLRSLYLSMYKQGLESFVERILTLVRSKLVLSQDKRGAFNKVHLFLLSYETPIIDQVRFRRLYQSLNGFTRRIRSRHLTSDGS